MIPELFNMANWPLWAQIPGAIIGLYALWNFLKMPLTGVGA